jgi:hypothetical protein
LRHRKYRSFSASQFTILVTRRLRAAKTAHQREWPKGSRTDTGARSKSWEESLRSSEPDTDDNKRRIRVQSQQGFGPAFFVRNATHHVSAITIGKYSSARNVSRETSRVFYVSALNTVDHDDP